MFAENGSSVIKQQIVGSECMNAEQLFGIYHRIYAQYIQHFVNSSVTNHKPAAEPTVSLL